MVVFITRGGLLFIVCLLPWDLGFRSLFPSSGGLRGRLRSGDGPGRKLNLSVLRWPLSRESLRRVFWCQRPVGTDGSRSWYINRDRFHECKL